MGEIKETQQTESGPDMNHVEKAGGYSRDCSSGVHDFNQLSTRFEIGAEGMTIMYMTCMVCGKEIAKEAPLNINDLLVKHTPNVETDTTNQFQQESRQTNQPQRTNNPEPTPVMDMDTFWKKLKG